MSNPTLYQECNKIPTQHKFTLCKEVLVCPICLSSRGFHNLNYCPCFTCADAEKSDSVAEFSPKRIRLDNNNNSIIELNIDTADTVSILESTSSNSTQKNVSVDGVEFNSTTNGTIISSFQLSTVLHRKIINDDDMKAGYDTEGKIGPFKSNEVEVNEEVALPSIDINNNSVIQEEILDVEKNRSMTVDKLKEELRKKN